jgi:hypothetical protein
MGSPLVEQRWAKQKGVGVGEFYSSLILSNNGRKWMESVVSAVAFSFLGIAGRFWIIVYPLPVTI